MSLFKKKDKIIDPIVELAKKEKEANDLKNTIKEQNLDTDEVKIGDNIKEDNISSNPIIDYLNYIGSNAATLEVERFKLLVAINDKLDKLLEKK